MKLFRWVAGEWNKCSVTCGEGFQTRDISCKQDISPVLSINVADDSCNTPAPELLLLVRNCHQPPCVEHIEHKPKQNDWQVGPWSMVRKFFLLKKKKNFNKHKQNIVYGE